MGRLLPADTAMNFSNEYQSVVVFGCARLLEDPREAERALQLLLDRYFPHLHPGQDYRPITESELNATAVFCLDIEEWSGKRKTVGKDFPGSFLWGEGPGK
jgi:nitroimidazol reductase NimA-like FMN-containing flavoprotein (pyridoxamine 5'-phosphate oxidase superfamily)